LVAVVVVDFKIMVEMAALVAAAVHLLITIVRRAVLALRVILEGLLVMVIMVALLLPRGPLARMEHPVVVVRERLDRMVNLAEIMVVTVVLVKIIPLHSVQV
jgi:hypothetical protein